MSDAHHYVLTQTPFMQRLLEKDMRRAIKAAGGTVPPRIAQPLFPAPPKVTPKPKIVKTLTGEPTLQSLLRAVSERCQVSYLDLISPRRTPKPVYARTIYYVLARRLTSKSLPAIGRACGGRDHSTVHHGIQKVEKSPSDYEPYLSELLAACQPVTAPEDPAP